jgi:phosphate starvation-inducible protein PhoH
LTSADVVRHSLVAKIVEAYSKYDEKKNSRNDVGTRRAQKAKP